MNFKEIVTEINNAFFRVDSFMNGKISSYQYFGFNETFTKLFVEVRKPENFTYLNCKLIGSYWKLIQQISFDIDKCDYINIDFVWNEDNEAEVLGFDKDVNEIMFLYNDTLDEFNTFLTSDEIEEDERKFTITDILKPPFKDAETKPIDKQSTPVINPFKDKQTAELFEYIIENCEYDKNQKYADIWNEIEFSENYKAPYQYEYQKYIITRFGYTGRFQYSYTKDPNNRNRQRLSKLIETFSKK